MIEQDRLKPVKITSELIKDLQESLENNGDLPVYVIDYLAGVSPIGTMRVGQDSERGAHLIVG